MSVIGWAGVSTRRETARLTLVGTSCTDTGFLLGLLAEPLAARPRFEHRAGHPHHRGGVLEGRGARHGRGGPGVPAADVPVSTELLSCPDVSSRRILAGRAVTLLFKFYTAIQAIGLIVDEEGWRIDPTSHRCGRSSQFPTLGGNTHREFHHR